MKRGFFVSGAVISLVAAFAGGEGCGSSNRGLTGPTTPSGPIGPTMPSGTIPSGPTYTISGSITEYRGGPAGGVTVYATTPSGYAQTTTSTDQHGYYSLTSPSTGPIFLGVWKSGYANEFQINVSSQDSAVNFVLDRVFRVNSLGDTVAGTIWGDEFLAGDDVFFGGSSSSRPRRRSW
jgi:hypothetical protein